MNGPSEARDRQRQEHAPVRVDDGQRGRVLDEALDAVVEALEDDGQGRERLAGAHPGHELVDAGPLVVQDLDTGVDLCPRGEQVRLDGAAPLGGLVGQHLGNLR